MSPTPDSSHQPAPVWQSLRLTPPPALFDSLSGRCFELGAEGTWTDGDDLVAYFPATTRRDEVELALSALLRHLADGGTAIFVPEYRWEREQEGNWISAWKDHFVPIPVGHSLIVLPDWEDNAQGRIPIRIKPGQGFGTGGHATTATCLERIETFLADHPGCTVLDVGTGSGILAIAARKLGAERVDAFDTDPDAVANAIDNAALNEVELSPFSGAIGTLDGPYDLVLANLISHVIVDLMGELKRVTRPGGRLILSGILNEQGDRIDWALAANGLKAVTYTSRGMWLTIDAEYDG